MTTKSSNSHLTFVHIEDEFTQFEGIVTQIQGYIEDYLFEDEAECSIAVNQDEIASSVEDNAAWKVYEFKHQALGNKIVRVVFIESAEIPPEVNKYVLGRPCFILDVLRPETALATLLVSLERTLKSVDQFSPRPDDIVLFTAHMNEIKLSNARSVPRRILKVQKSALDHYLAERVIEFLSLRE